MSPSILSGVAFRAASPEPMSGLATSNSPTAAGGTNSQVGIPKGQQQQQHPDPNRQLSGQTVKSVQSVQSGQTHVSTRTFSGGGDYDEWDGWGLRTDSYDSEKRLTSIGLVLCRFLMMMMMMMMMDDDNIGSWVLLPSFSFVTRFIYRSNG
ncbi:hypothetical protein K435DRAFT_881557 [Dendrothele bispora CBS 962.96]|uniref:Uncharacterized protein n=1 Tax=Dendrothele bispora (strain CBS 962.96) TaxID=1314807 RepID=A0A4S8KIB0_DENBC|nr:hypothetical protein K435DRAFT_881557 [Dendrothele bispora CBS 962.96]